MSDDYDIYKKKIDDRKANRPNFKIGSYQIRTNDFSFWFDDSNRKRVTGYYSSINKKLFNDLIHYDSLYNHDLSGDLLEYIEKLKDAHRGFERAVRDVLKLVEV